MSSLPKYGICLSRDMPVTSAKEDHDARIKDLNRVDRGVLALILRTNLESPAPVVPALIAERVCQIPLLLSHPERVEGRKRPIVHHSLRE